MIVTKDVNPEKDIYYLGALALEVLKECKSNKVDFFDAYQAINKKEKISISLFSLILDWLFLLGAVKSNKRFIIKCF